MPLGKLIYMPEESTPTIATEGNREAVAYLELGEHTHDYGRLFTAAPQLLEALKFCIANDGGECLGDHTARFAAARAAVAKATGAAS